VTKSQLADAVADRAGLSRTQATEAVDAVVRTIEEVLAAGGDVALAGFGRFSVGERGARRGVNPRTGEAIAIDAVRVARFSAGTHLKRAVRGA
jgi:DNA-binding protein HU-beta